jgi:hypothetical protein
MLHCSWYLLACPFQFFNLCQQAHMRFSQLVMASRQHL